MDAIEILEHDHRMVEQLFRDYQAAANDTQRRGVVEILIRELSKHAALEELMIYPLAQEVLPDGKEEIEKHLSEHMVLKKLLVELDKLEEGHEKTDEVWKQVEQETLHHVQDEESDLLPRLAERVDHQALEELGAELDKAKKIAPTRAHPAAPTEPPALALAAPVAAIYDRMRDRLQGRPLT